MRPGERHGAPQRPNDENGPTTFGPGLALYLVPLLGLIFGGVVLYWFLEGRGTDAPDAVDAILGMAASLVFIGAPLFTWARYRLDSHGVERRMLVGRTRWAWESIGSVGGQAIERADAHFASTTRWVVRGVDGRELFRISVWTKRKRELAQHVRRRASAAHLR